MGLDGYEPMFKGQLPADWKARWKLIRQFVDFWCMDQDALLVDRSHERTSLIEKAEDLCDGDVSPSIRQWLSLAEEARVRGAPHIRDCLIVEPIEENFDDPTATDATVILMQGEGDVFWVVPNNRFGEDDPPVDVFQKFDEDSPAHYLRYANVSEFTLAYLCSYNAYAKGNTEWFTANGNDDDFDEVRKWFQYSLVIDSHGGESCRFLEFLENENAAAFVRDSCIEVSLFCEPSEVDMPSFLRAEMEDHLKSREEFDSLCRRMINVPAHAA